MSSMPGGLLRRFVLLLILPAISACSIYQSEGRKFLEKNAYEYSNVSALNLQSCSYGSVSSEWLEFSSTPTSTAFTSDQNEFALLIVSHAQNTPSFACQFQFSSAQEMVERTEAASELTLLHQSLGEFAFRPLSHIK